jgi:hypothetical protein
VRFIEGNGREVGTNVIKSWIVIPVPRLLAIICDTVSSFLVVLHSSISYRAFTQNVSGAVNYIRLKKGVMTTGEFINIRKYIEKSMQVKMTPENR